MVAKITVGTRGSQLALWQTNYVCDALRKISPQTKIAVRRITTAGDRDQNAPVAALSGKGVFIKEIEDALLSGEVDLAVHSMKDVPTEVPCGLRIGAVLERQDVRDVLVAREPTATLKTLPRGARIGTSSLRRRAQLQHFRSDLMIENLRGNVNTRLKKLEEGMYDAIVLAKAGLDRLGWSDRITEILSTEIALPAVGQGAMGVECREGDGDILDLLNALNHGETRAAVDAERALLRDLEGGCQVPIGAWVRVENQKLVMEACVVSLDGKEYVRDRVEGCVSDAPSLGFMLAKKLLAQGADQILAAIRGTEPPAVAPGP